jgi:HD-like signal output (HDOD) protein
MKIELSLPAHPQTLIQLSELLRKPDVNLSEVGSLIETDLSLAAAVMDTINAPIYGLKGRVQSIQQAVTFLGLREISAIAYETTLRAAFPPVPELLAVWERARMRGLLMGRLAQALSMEAWGAHTAGLFEECGKAVLFAHAPGIYSKTLAAAGDDNTALIDLERRAFETDHAEVGASLCESWGLPPATVNCVRFHVTTQATLRLPHASHRYVSVLSVLANTLLKAPDKVDEVVGKIAPQAMMDQTSLLRALGKVKGKIDDALEDA